MIGDKEGACLLDGAPSSGVARVLGRIGERDMPRVRPRAMERRMGRPRKTRYACLPGDFWRDARVRKKSLAAIAVHALAQAYCADQRSDGRVPGHMLAALGDARSVRRAVAELVAEPSLWRRDGDDFVLSDWHRDNISVSDDDARLAADSERKSRELASFPVGKSPETASISGSIPSVSQTHDSGHLTQDSGHTTRQDTRASECASHIRRHFAAAYEQALAVPWGDGGYGQEIARVAAWLARTEDPEAVIRRAVAAFFADPWAQEKRYPFGAFAKDPGKYAAASSTASRRASAEELAEARRRLRLEYDRRHQAAKSDAEQRAALDWWTEEQARIEEVAA